MGTYWVPREQLHPDMVSDFIAALQRLGVAGEDMYRVTYDSQELVRVVATIGQSSLIGFKLVFDQRGIERMIDGIYQKQLNNFDKWCRFYLRKEQYGFNAESLEQRRQELLEALEAVKLNDCVHPVVKNLPGLCGAVVVLYYGLNDNHPWTLDAISAAIGLDIPVVQQQLWTAEKAIRKNLEDQVPRDLFGLRSR